MLQKLKMASVVIAILFFLLSLLAVLQFYRFQTLLFEVNSSRISVPAQSLQSDVERSLAFGLPLQSNVQLRSMLENVIEKYPDIRSIQLLGSKVEPGKIFWQAGASVPEAESLSAILAHRQARKVMWFDSSHASNFIQVWSVRDPIGDTVADLILRVDNSEAKALLADARAHLIQYWLLLCGAALVFLAPVLVYLFLSLDRLIHSAGAILRGETPSSPDASRSEICDLATQVANSDRLDRAQGSACQPR